MAAKAAIARRPVRAARWDRDANTEALKKAFGDIMVAITDPTTFAYALYSAELINQSTRESVANERISVSERASKLVSAVLTSILSDPSHMGAFVTELRKSGPAGEVVANKFALGECELTADSVCSVQIS